MNDLKRCPFCGGVAHFHVLSRTERGTNRGIEFEVKCERCGITNNNFRGVVEYELLRDGSLNTVVDDRRKVIEAWNNRKGETNG